MSNDGKSERQRRSDFDAIREACAEHLAYQSEWRAQKAEEYPNDDRNARAAADLAGFASDLRQDELEPVVSACLKRLEDLCELDDGHVDPSFNDVTGKDVTSALHLWNTPSAAGPALGVPMPVGPTLAQVLLEIIRATEEWLAELET